MTSIKEHTRRREVYASLANRGGVEPRAVAAGLHYLAELERQGSLVLAGKLSNSVIARALNVRSGIPDELSAQEIRDIAELGQVA